MPPKATRKPASKKPAVVKKPAAKKPAAKPPTAHAIQKMAGDLKKAASTLMRHSKQLRPTKK